MERRKLSCRGKKEMNEINKIKIYKEKMKKGLKEKDKWQMRKLSSMKKNVQGEKEIW